MPGTIDFSSGGRAYRHGKELKLPAKPACAHSIDALRFDGFWNGEGELRAQVTCTVEGCNRSFTVPVRADVAAKYAAGSEGAVGSHDTTVAKAGGGSHAEIRDGSARRDGR